MKTIFFNLSLLFLLLFSCDYPHNEPVNPLDQNNPEVIDNPYNLTVKAENNGNRLDWSFKYEGFNLTGFNIYRSEKKEGKYTAIASVEADVYNFTDTKATDGKKYHYKIAAFKGKSTASLALLKKQELAAETFFDFDGDGQRNSKDNDIDGDGVLNTKDKCPKEKAAVLKDKNRDGCNDQTFFVTNEWLNIEGGTFAMGSSDGQSDEQPVHSVTLSAFKMLKFEVTAEEYKLCVAAGKCTEPDTGGSCTYNGAGKEKHPVNCVDYSQSSSYCEWIGGALPTEAQWEYGARGTDGRKYPWGNTEPSASENDLANCDNNLCFDIFSETSPVGSFEKGKSPFGLYDMAGNVWERTEDWYGSYTSEVVNNPTGPASGTDHIFRGGGWANNANDIRSAGRNDYDPSHSSLIMGFRCALPQ